MTDSFEGMNPEFATRLHQLIAASGGRVFLRSGYRSIAEQTALWNAAVKKYGAERARHFVAPPGHSNHNAGIAADLGGDLNLAHELAARFGLYFPMNWEKWHVEPIGSRDKSHPDAYTVPPGVEYHTENVPLAVDPAQDPHNMLSHLAHIGGMLGNPDVPEPGVEQTKIDEEQRKQGVNQ